jgi:hypothetical protein
MLDCSSRCCGTLCASSVAAQRLAVRQSFADPVLRAFDIHSETDDGVVVDGTPFFLCNAFDIVGQLSALDDGTFTLDVARCAVAGATGTPATRPATGGWLRTNMTNRPNGHRLVLRR